MFRRQVDCVVVSNAWEMPHKSSVRFWLPPVFESFCTAFEAFYGRHFADSSPRKLTWLYNEGSAVVTATLGANTGTSWKGDLLLSPLQVHTAAGVEVLVANASSCPDCRGAESCARMPLSKPLPASLRCAFCCCFHRMRR